MKFSYMNMKSVITKKMNNEMKYELKSNKKMKDEMNHEAFFMKKDEK